MNNKNIVTVTNLSKLYGEFVAVNDISFSIRKGEIYGFLGPNGAGKTTTINMMIGLARPTGGVININGVDAVKNVKKRSPLLELFQMKVIYTMRWMDSITYVFAVLFTV